MICIARTETDPFFNIAAEEYVLRHFTDECFMLWQNSPAVIVGKHQNTLAEINLDFVNRNNIAVVRRISGGGAVYHDLGNVNFTFIARGNQDKLVDFRKFTQPIIEVLADFNVDARFEGRNNLTVDGKKISGNAEHVFKNKVIHHGTLLFNTDLQKLSQALYVEEAKWNGRAVKSVRSCVANISDYLTQPISVHDFIGRIIGHVLEKYPHANLYSFLDYDRENIKMLAAQKYSTWDWNFGYSPPYRFQNIVKVSNRTIEVSFGVENGRIAFIEISGDLFNSTEKVNIENALIGSRHYPGDLHQSLEYVWFELQVQGITINRFVSAMF